MTREYKYDEGDLNQKEVPEKKNIGIEVKEKNLNPLNSKLDTGGESICRVENIVKVITLIVGS